MKHLWKKIMLFCLLILVCCGCGKQARKRLEVDIRYNGNDYWEKYDMTDTLYPTPEALQKRTEEYIVQIEDILHLYNWWEYLNEQAETLIINMTIEEGYRSHARFLSLAAKDEVKTNIRLGAEFILISKLDGQLAHELTHTIVGDSFSRSLSEGLSEYTQGRLGPENYAESYGWTWEETFKLYLNTLQENGFSTDTLEDIISNVGVKGYEYPYLSNGVLGSTMENDIWYHYSRSFVEYLAEQYGIEKVVALARQGETEADYETYFGKSFEVIKEEWVEHLDNIEPTMTFEEMAEAEKEWREKSNKK
ncbi:MAG: hypothetical protein IJN16_10550 [Lachnospiraceae bacterium]|nr:hypothetical protein [Lachnospiraceae bacterium]